MGNIFKTLLKIGAVIAGVAAFVATGGLAAVGAFLSSGSIAALAARTLLTIGISKLIANRAGTNAASESPMGVRFSLEPATTNKLPVVYGSAYMPTITTDAMISTDQTTMWYVLAISEVTDNGTFSFGDVYYDGKKVALGTGDYGATNKVISLTTNSTPPQVDTSIDGNMWIYGFTNGSSSGVNTGGKTAIEILQDPAIPATSQWSSTDLMSNTCFAIVKLKYNQNANIYRLGRLQVQVNNSLNEPGSVLKDYLVNERYGCGVDISKIDTASLDLLDDYSNELITYTPEGGGSATQPRYRINGAVDTGSNCLSNLQLIVDSADSWLQYSELTAKWKVVINQSYADNPLTPVITDLYHVNNDTLVSGIEVSPIDLNQSYNALEVQYFDANIRDQAYNKTLFLVDYVPEVISPNEAPNKLVVQYQLVNNYIQSLYLGERRLLQSREDLVISFGLDYSGIQIEAGDVIRVTLDEYGWNAPSFPDGKLFRVSQVQETKDDKGNLGARITAFEYNDTIYSNNPIQDFIPADNTGLTNPNIFDKPSTPVVTNGPIANGSTNYYIVSSNVPAVGTTLYLDFNIGNSSNTATHKSYSSVQVGDGTPYTSSSPISINVADSSPGTYYWSTTARNQQGGRQSNSSSAFVWNGPSVSTYDPTSNVGGIGYVNINPTASPEERMNTVAFGIPYVGGNTVTMPVQVDANSIINQPVYLNGTTVPANYYYPYYQATSTTANGYLATSTSSFQPARASYQVLNNGDDNWYGFIYAGFGDSPNYPLDPTEYFKLEFNGTFLSNADTVMQLGMFYTTSTNPGTIYHDTTIDGTWILPANVPLEISFTQAYESTANNTTDGGGLILKNIVGNTRVTTLYNKLEIFKGRFS